MPRPLRFEFENAWYHVMNRGVNHQLIYKNDFDRYDFIEVFLRGVKLYGIEIHAYCLMGNHYHLLIKTPHANLSRAMQFINGTYSSRFNKMHNRDGPLFRGRFKAVLVENNEYLYRVSRYIHLNPVEAKLVALPEEYKWSSYLDYLGVRPGLFNLMKTHEILLPFNNNPGEYQKYINQGVDKDTKKFYQSNKTSSIYGRKIFKKLQLEKLSKPTIRDCVIDYNATNKMLTTQNIVERCAKYFHCSRVLVANGRKPKAIQARKVSVYCCRKFTKATIKEVADYFGYLSSSRVHQICREVEKGDLYSCVGKIFD